MKLKAFLASSTQSKPLMDRIAAWLESWGLKATPWDSPGVFQPGDYILARLLDLSEEVDAAIVIFGDEDKEWYYKDAQPQPRDNVLIEYGIFASRLGRQRTVICRRGSPKHASDLGGLIFVQFGKRLEDATAKERLRRWAESLPELVRQAREKESRLRKAEDAALPSRLDVSLTLQADSAREIAIKTGSLRDIRDVDVIVSSENTDLQPARFYDRSMSGTLRYLDAVKRRGDLRVQRDAYLQSLELAKKQEHVRIPVLLGAVLPAVTTGLKEQGVKYVFHAAMVQGDVEVGYRASEEAIERGIQNCFRRFGELSRTKRLRSILFPVFGGGTGGLEVQRIAKRMIAAVQKGMEVHQEVTQVVLFAHVEAHLRALREAAALAGWKRRR